MGGMVPPAVQRFQNQGGNTKERLQQNVTPGQIPNWVQHRRSMSNGMGGLPQQAGGMPPPQMPPQPGIGLPQMGGGGGMGGPMPLPSPTGGFNPNLPSSGQPDIFSMLQGLTQPGMGGMGGINKQMGGMNQVPRFGSGRMY